jgi:hypothetical protein
VGDHWIYEARDANYPEKKYQVVVDVLSAGPAGIREALRFPDGNVEMTHQSAMAMVGVAPGIANFHPYLRAFQEVRGGERWPDIDANGLWTCAAAGVHCKASARVAGKERVTVRGATYDAWKIVVDLQVRLQRGGGSGEFAYWYAEETKRIVKYQARMNVASHNNNPFEWMQPNMDMELVSYRPAGTK